MRILKESDRYLERKIQQKKRKADSYNEEISALKGQISQNSEQIDALRSRVNKIKSERSTKNNIIIILLIVFLGISVFSFMVKNQGLFLVSMASFVAISLFLVNSQRTQYRNIRSYQRILADHTAKQKEYEALLEKYTRIFDYTSDDHMDYVKGLLGERSVTETLKSLDDDYYLINDILLDRRYGNIDHVLLSPHGIFVIETKNWDGKYRCEGDDWYLDGGTSSGRPLDSVSIRVKGNSAKLSQMIEEELFKNYMKIWVQGLVVFTSQAVDLILHDPTIPVLRLEELKDFLTNYRSPSGMKFSSRDLESIGRFILKEAGQGSSHSR
jgi:hypothetical protein